MIPFVDLKVQIQKIKSELQNKFTEILDSNSFINGKFVRAFEAQFIEMHKAAFGAACSNGTSALRLALGALGVGPGDEVITAPNSFASNAEVAYHVGAKPVFVDIDPDTHAIDCSKIEKAITDKTKVLIPVHLYGNPADMLSVMNIAKKHNLYVIEDAAQAHFATLKDKYVGSFGDLATFSFYPGKNLGACGDAGFVFAKEKEKIEQVRRLLNHGRIEKKYEHDIVGFNDRMDDIQAGVLLVKLKYIHDWTAMRRSHAALYDKYFAGTQVKPVKPTPGSKPVYHLYVVEVNNRDEVMAHLKSKDIGCSIHYPIPLHIQPAFSDLGYRKEDFPVASAVANRILSIPMYPELTEEQISIVAEELLKVARR